MVVKAPVDASELDRVTTEAAISEMLNILVHHTDNREVSKVSIHLFDQH